MNIIPARSFAPYNLLDIGLKFGEANGAVTGDFFAVGDVEIIMARKWRRGFGKDFAEFLYCESDIVGGKLKLIECGLRIQRRQKRVGIEGAAGLSVHCGEPCENI